MRSFCKLIFVFAFVLLPAQRGESQQVLPLVLGLPAGNQSGEEAGKPPNHEAAVLHEWMQYSKAFEYADYPQIANHFTFPATVIEASGQPTIAEDRDKLIERYREGRENIQEGYKYSLLETHKFHQYSDKVCMVDATYGRFNASYQRIYTGRGLYFFRKTSDGWRMFSIMVMPEK